VAAALSAPLFAFVYVCSFCVLTFLA
jgi:hypothetical protein